MDKNSNRPEFNDSSPHRGSARLTAVTSAGRKNPSIAANLSIALAKRGKHVCLITTDCPSSNNRTQPDQSWGSPLEDLLVAKKVLAEILLDGSAGTQILPAGSIFKNFFNLEGAKQKLLIELLAELEAAFDHLLVETPVAADNSLLHIYQAAPLILLSITPEADSLTGAFSLLRMLKRQHGEQQVHVIVEMAENLPNAHDTFKKLQHAASKYLQQELHYLGFFPLRQPLKDKAEGSHAAAGLYSGSHTKHLAAITDRFCVISETIAPLTSLSSYYSGLSAAQKTSEERVKSGLVQANEMAEKMERLTPGAAQKPENGYKELSDISGLHAAVHYAARLAQREAHRVTAALPN